MPHWISSYCCVYFSSISSVWYLTNWQEPFDILKHSSPIEKVMFVIFSRISIATNTIGTAIKCDVAKPDFESIEFLVILVLTFAIFILDDVWLFYLFFQSPLDLHRSD